MMNPYLANPLFQLGAGIMSETGRGVPGGQAVGRGILSGMDSLQDYQSQQMRMAQAQQQMAERERAQRQRQETLEKQRALFGRMATPTTEMMGPPTPGGILEQQTLPPTAAQSFYGQVGDVLDVTGSPFGASDLMSIMQHPAQQAAAARQQNIQNQIDWMKAQPKQTSLQQNIDWAMSLPEGDPRKDIAIQSITKPMVSMMPQPQQGQQLIRDQRTGALRAEPIPGYQSPATQQQIQRLDTTLASLDRYEDLISKSGPELLPGAQKTRLSTEYTNLLMDLKEMANLGVLSGPDLSLMQDMLANPTSLPGFIKGESGIKAQVDQIRKMLQGKKNALNPEQPRTEGRKATPQELRGTIELSEY